MTRFEELAKTLNGVEEAKKGFVLSLLKDFVWLEEQIIKLREYPRYIINDKNPLQQKKLPAHDMIKEYQAQKNDIATKILKALEKESVSDQLAEVLSRFE